MTDAPQTMDTPRDARARAKAEKAYKKASRQKRFVLLLILIVIIAIWAASQSGSDSPSTPAQPSSAAEPSTGETAAEAPAAPEPGSAESDVVVTSCDVGDFDMVTSTLTVTNSTDEPRVLPHHDLGQRPGRQQGGRADRGGELDRSWSVCLGRRTRVRHRCQRRADLRGGRCDTLQQLTPLPPSSHQVALRIRARGRRSASRPEDGSCRRFAVEPGSRWKPEAAVCVHGPP